MTWLSERELVVVPLDHSEPSYRALAVAIDMVGASRVRAIHAQQPIVTMVLDYAAPGEFDEGARMDRARAMIAAEMRRRGAGEVILEVRLGAPSPIICDYCAEIDADLVVIPSHGRSGLKRAFLGSVAEQVIRHAGCPVLVLRRDRAE